MRNVIIKYELYKAHINFSRRDTENIVTERKSNIELLRIIMILAVLL